MAIKKKIEQLETEVRLQQVVKEERGISDKTYARKVFETATIWVAALICAAVLVAVVNIVLHPIAPTTVPSVLSQ